MTHQDHAAALLPCPFCNQPASVEKIGRDWWCVVVDHPDDCAFDSDHRLYSWQTDDGLKWLVSAWNTRAQPQQPDGWRPIETAPKNGTHIILSNGTDVSQGHWLHEEPYIRERRDADGRYIDQEESDGFDGWIDFLGGMLPEPTMWQPLPSPTAHPSQQEDDGRDAARRERMRDAIAAALGDAYDCLRVWSAWSVGTMGPDDFSLIAEDDERLDEITDAAIAAMSEIAGEGGKNG